LFLLFSDQGKRAAKNSSWGKYKRLRYEEKSNKTTTEGERKEKYKSRGSVYTKKEGE